MSKNRDRIRSQDRVRSNSNEESDRLDEMTSLPPVKTRHRFPTFTLTVLGVLLLLVAFAPTLLCLTPYARQLVSSAAQGQIDGTLETQSVSLGWFSPVTLRRLTVKNKVGETLGTVDSLVVSKSLLGLITNSSDLGTIVIHKPQVTVVARPDGSNIEDLLAPLLSKPASGGAPAVTVEIHDAAVKLVDATTQQSWEFTPLAAQLQSPRSSHPHWQVAVQAKLQDSGVTAKLLHSLGESSQSAVTLEADRFPLEPLQPILTRLLGLTRIAGAVSGKIEAEIADGGKKQRLVLENVEAANVAFTSEQLIGSDIVDLAQVQASGTAELSGGVWQLRNLNMVTDIASLAGSGDVRVSDFTSAQAVPQTDCNLRGVVDLARLLKMLPNTLRARPDVQLTSGEATLSLTSNAVSGGRRFTASLATENVQAINNGRPVALREPVQLVAAVLQTPQGWQIEQLEARSSFLTVDGSGTTASGKLSLRGDLNKLAAELDQFVDMGDIRLAGQIDGAAQWKADAGDSLAASGQLNFTAFELSAPGVMPWREDDLAVTFQGRGISLEKYSVGSGKLAVISDTDRLDVILEQGVQGLDSAAPLPLDVRLAGNLATWLPRLQGFLPLNGWQASGPILLAAKGTASGTSINVSQANLDITQLRLQGPGLFVAEPIVKAKSSVRYDVPTGTTTITDLLVQSQAVAASANQLVVHTGKEFKIDGEAMARGDITRVLSWIASSEVPNSQFTGELETEITFTHVAGATKANLKGQVKDLMYAVRDVPPEFAAGRVPARPTSTTVDWKNKWQQPLLVTFGGDAAYDAAKDSLTLDKLQVAQGTSALVASGAISQLATRWQLDLTGQLNYDLAAWVSLLQHDLGQSFDMYGSGAKAFEVHGPLFTAASSRPEDASLIPQGLAGKATLGWKGLSWMALDVGEADVTAELENAVVTVQPTKIPLSQGFLQVAPSIDLRGNNWLVTHGQGRVIDNIVITREMCSTWIKYVAPTIAEATEAQGKFSVDIEHAHVPINQPKTFDSKGTFVVHHVAAGPGPLARDLIGTVQKVKDFTDGKLGLEGLAGAASGLLNRGAQSSSTPVSDKQWLELPEQDVAVEVVDGRVYHKDLVMKVGKDVTIRSTGSVGLADQSLNLLCEMPIPDAWLKDPKLAGLKGQTIKIPIKGTLTNHEIDSKAAMSGLLGLGFAGAKSAVTDELTKKFGGALGGAGADPNANPVQDQINKAETKVQSEIEKGTKKVEDKLRGTLKSFFPK